MTKSIKSGIAILLLGTFLFHLSGYYLVMNVYRYQIQQGVKQYIRSLDKGSNCRKFTYKQIIDKNFVWEEVGKEFSYYGEMFDIVKAETTNHGPVLYCYSDTRESNLLAGFRKITALNFQGASSTNPAVCKIIELLQATYLNSLYKTVYQLDQDKIVWQVMPSPSLTNQSLDIILPPPEYHHS